MRHDERDEQQILGYLDGSMTPREVASFEERMDADPELGAEVAAWRETLAAASDWLAAPAPGLERAEALPVPELVPVRRRARWWKAAQTAVAATFFIGGFSAGWLARTSEFPAPEVSIVEATRAAPTTVTPVEVQYASYPVDEGQRLVVQPTPQSVWVVDAGFNMDVRGATPEGA